MKIFLVRNKNNNKRIILAKNKKSAQKIFHQLGFSRSIENSKTNEITEEYLNHNSRRGFDLKKLKRGLLIEPKINYKNDKIGSIYYWSTILT